MQGDRGLAGSGRSGEVGAAGGLFGDHAELGCRNERDDVHHAVVRLLGFYRGGRGGEFGAGADLAPEAGIQLVDLRRGLDPVQRPPVDPDLGLQGDETFPVHSADGRLVLLVLLEIVEKLGDFRAAPVDDDHAVSVHKHLLADEIHLGTDPGVRVLDADGPEIRGSLLGELNQVLARVVVPVIDEFLRDAVFLLPPQRVQSLPLQFLGAGVVL